MDGYASVAGLLYAEDFGRARPPPPPPPAAPPAPRPLDQADIDAACERAVQAARDAWAGDAAERRTAALTALAAGLAEAEAAAARNAEEVADALARTMLSMLAGALPHLCRAHGDAEVRALARHLLPLIARTTPVVARVHAGLLDALRLDLAEMDEAVLDRIELRPANLPPGDARIAWEDGSLVRDGAALCAALNDALAQLGLILPEAAPERSLALAQ